MKRLMEGAEYTPAQKTNVALTMVRYAKTHGIQVSESLIQKSQGTLPVEIPKNLKGVRNV
jgi:hypothetical protein